MNNAYYKLNKEHSEYERYVQEGKKNKEIENKINENIKEFIKLFPFIEDSQLMYSKHNLTLLGFIPKSYNDIDYTTWTKKDKRNGTIRLKTVKKNKELLEKYFKLHTNEIKPPQEVYVQIMSFEHGNFYMHTTNIFVVGENVILSVPYDDKKFDEPQFEYLKTNMERITLKTVNELLKVE